LTDITYTGIIKIYQSKRNVSRDGEEKQLRLWRNTNMLKVDDRFKCWLRFRLKDKAYAEKFVKCTTELEDKENAENQGNA
jgi:hypothetical protein